MFLENLCVFFLLPALLSHFTFEGNDTWDDYDYEYADNQRVITPEVN